MGLILLKSSKGGWNLMDGGDGVDDGYSWDVVVEIMMSGRWLSSMGCEWWWRSTTGVCG